MASHICEKASLSSMAPRPSLVDSPLFVGKMPHVSIGFSMPSGAPSRTHLWTWVSGSPALLTHASMISGSKGDV